MNAAERLERCHVFAVEASRILDAVREELPEAPIDFDDGDTSLPAQLARVGGVVDDIVDASETRSERHVHARSGHHVKDSILRRHGDAGASLAGTEFMAWDEDRFPFWLPAETIVTAARRTASPIPRITEDSSAAATCPLGASLTGGAACFSRKGSGWSALAGPSGGGVGHPTHPRVRIRKGPVARFPRTNRQRGGAARALTASTAPSTRRDACTAGTHNEAWPHSHENEGCTGEVAADCAKCRTR